jgi:hypothetical protein
LKVASRNSVLFFSVLSPLSSSTFFGSDEDDEDEEDGSKEERAVNGMKNFLKKDRTKERLGNCWEIMETKEEAYLVSINLLLSSGKSGKIAATNSITICNWVLDDHTLGPLNPQLNSIDLLVKSDSVTEAEDEDEEEEEEEEEEGGAKLRK